MAIRGIVFDIGGVLEYTPYTGWLDRWNERLGFGPHDIINGLMERGLDGGLGTCTEAEWLAGLQEITGFDESQIDEFMGDLWADYLGTLNEELVAYVRELRPTYKTAILSNSFLGAREKEQALYGFEDLFDMLIYSHEVNLLKPDPQIYELTCKSLNLKPEEVIFVDDADVNIEGANEFGIHAILFENNTQLFSELEDVIQQNAT